MRRSIAFFIVWLVGAATHAQWDPAQYMVKRYTMEDGLSQSSVMNIVEDSTGFLWVATEDGINRFDGREFRIYRDHWAGGVKRRGLRAYTLVHTSTGTLVGGTFDDGLLVFDPMNDRFEKFISDTSTGNTDPGDFIRTIFEWGEDSLLVTGATGTFLIELARMRSTPLHELCPVMSADMLAWEMARLGDHVFAIVHTEKGGCALLRIGPMLGDATFIGKDILETRLHTDPSTNRITSKDRDLCLYDGQDLWHLRSPNERFVKFQARCDLGPRGFCWLHGRLMIGT